MTLNKKSSKATTTAIVGLLVLLVTLNLLWLSSRRYYKDIPSLAGKNRSELAKVLKHYSGKHGDSLKLEAARFLINNMVYHHGSDQYLTDRTGNRVDFDYSKYPHGR